MLRRLALALLVTAVACSSGSSKKPETAPAAMTLTSPAFAENASIPAQFTCDGPDLSPPVSWSGVPKGARSTALIVEDLDRSFLHWLVYDLPPTQTSLGPGYAPGLTAVNDFGKQGYSGPCPPAGERHRYRFTVLALKGRMQITGTGTSGKQLQQQLTRSPLGRGELTGTYQRAGS